jgi:hypothetical protein
MRFLPNPFFERDISTDEDHLDGLEAAAQKGAERAEMFARAAGAPWMKRAGALRTVVVARLADRVRIVNTDHGGHLMEWGSINNPPHAPLRRGAQAADLRFTEEPKD